MGTKVTSSLRDKKGNLVYSISKPPKKSDATRFENLWKLVKFCENLQNFVCFWTDFCKVTSSFRKSRQFYQNLTRFKSKTSQTGWKQLSHLPFLSFLSLKHEKNGAGAIASAPFYTPHLFNFRPPVKHFRQLFPIFSCSSEYLTIRRN